MDSTVFLIILLLFYSRTTCFSEEIFDNYECQLQDDRTDIDIGELYADGASLSFGSSGGGSVNCKWVFSAPAASKGFYFNFVSFDFPEDEENGEECKTNFVAVKSSSGVDSTSIELASYCGNGEIGESYDIKPGESIQLEAKSVGLAWRFEIQLKPLTGDVRGSGAENCPDGSHFKCPKHAQICLRNSLKCDGLPDCPDGGDEIECDYSKQHERDSGCGSRRYQEGVSGSFSSDRYPCAYESNHRCIWEIETPPNTTVVITFNDVFGIDDANGDANCPTDNLAIYSQPKLQSQAEELARLCGNRMPSVVVAPSNKVLVTFETAGFSHDSTNGFRLHWAAVSENDLSSFIGEDRAGPIVRKAKEFEQAETQLRKFSGAKACGKSQPSIIKYSAGIITSLNYQHGKTYPQKLDCSWQFEPKIEAGYKFKHFEFRFNDFDVPALQNCERAAVRLLMKTGNSWTEQDRYCNWKPVPRGRAIIVKSPSVRMDFDVNVRIAKAVGRGFSVEFKVATEKDEPMVEEPTTPSPPIRRTKTPLNPPQFKVAQCGVGPRTKKPARKRQNGSNLVRIVGGNPATPGDWRWHAHLISGKTHCGGTVITPRWILTAAHCFNGGRRRFVSDWKVKIGYHFYSDDRAWDGSEVVEPEIEAIILHKGYVASAHSNDIALIKLKKSLKTLKPDDPTIRTLCLPTITPEKFRKRVRKNCIVIGFGDTMGTGNQGVLMQASVPIMDTDECKAMNTIYQSKVNNDQMICAGFEGGKVDACQGDSGGSLACEIEPGHWEIQGVVSFGQGCAKEKAPGVYTKVWHYKQWINNIINEFSEKEISYEHA